MKLSVCTIVKNEESMIRQYIESVSKYADEIIIIDNGSTDRTIEIAEKLNCTIYFNDENTFDLVRNDYLTLAQGDWILTLDLDEVIIESQAFDLKRFLGQLKEEILAVFLPSLQYINMGHWATFYRCRLTRKNRNIMIDKSIHGSVGKSVRKEKGKYAFFYCPVHHMDALLSPERNSLKRERNIYWLKKELLKEPSGKSYSFLSLEYFALQKYSKAFEMVDMAIKLDSEKKSDSCAFLFKAQMYFEIGKYDESITHAIFQKKMSEKRLLEKIDVKGLDKFILDSCDVVLAKCLHAQNNDNDAKEIIQASIKRNPFLPHNYLNLTIFEPQRQVILTKKAISLNPLLTDFNMYRKVGSMNIYNQQTSLFDCIDLKKLVEQC